MPLTKLWRYRRLRLIAAALLLLAFLVVAAFEFETYYVRDQLAEQVYGWKPHRIPCEQWPTLGEVRQVIDRNAETVSRIESVNPGFVSVGVNTTRKCPGRADIEILYATYRDRDAIKAIIGDDKYLFGVPYRLRNT